MIDINFLCQMNSLVDIVWITTGKHRLYRAPREISQSCNHFVCRLYLSHTFFSLSLSFAFFLSLPIFHFLYYQGLVWTWHFLCVRGRCSSRDPAPFDLEKKAVWSVSVETDGKYKFPLSLCLFFSFIHSLFPPLTHTHAHTPSFPLCLSISFCFPALHKQALNADLADELCSWDVR